MLNISRGEKSLQLLWSSLSPPLGSFVSHCLSSEGPWSDFLSCILNLLEGKKGGGRRGAWTCVIGSSCDGLFPLTACPEELHVRRSKTSPRLACAFSALSPGLPHPVHFWIFSSTCFISLTLDGSTLNYT